MKSKLIVAFFAILTGVALALPVFLVKPKEKSSLISFYVLQVGAFNSYENAILKQQEVPGSIIYSDDSLYRVLIGASTSIENLEKVKNVLNEKNISYYEKEIQVFSDETEMVSNYNLLLEKAEEKETILLLNQKILENMVSV